MSCAPTSGYLASLYPWTCLMPAGMDLFGPANATLIVPGTGMDCRWMDAHDA